MVGDKTRRDDWRYFEDAWEESSEEEKGVPLPAQRQCPVCLHWIERGSLYCSWCGKPQEEERKKP